MLSLNNAGDVFTKQCFHCNGTGTMLSLNNQYDSITHLSPDVVAPADTAEEDSFESGGGGGGGSSNVSAGCNSPLVLTPRQSGSAEPNILSHLAKWSAAKIADKAEGMSDVSEGTDNANYGFRWIPEDDLERQAAEEYCPSKESSHEKLADRALPLHRSAAGRETSPAPAAAHPSPAASAHRPGPAPPDATAATTSTQAGRVTSAERATSGLDGAHGRANFQDLSGPEQDRISSATEPAQANAKTGNLGDMRGKHSGRHTTQPVMENNEETSNAKVVVGKTLSIKDTKGIALQGIPSPKETTRGSPVLSKVSISRCRASLDDMQIVIPPSNRTMHTKLRLPKMTTVVDLEASLQAMATAASSGGRGEAENCEEPLHSREFLCPGFKNNTSTSPTFHDDSGECQKSDFCKVALKQQSEMLSVLLGVSPPPHPTRVQKHQATTGDQRISEKRLTGELMTKLRMNAGSTITATDRFFDWHSQSDPVTRQLIEGQNKTRSFRRVNKIDRKLKNLGAIAEGMVPANRTKRPSARRVMLGREKGVKRRDETSGPGWEITGTLPATGHHLLSIPESCRSSICLTHLQSSLTDKHGTKEDKWVVGQDKSLVRQESHQAKRRQPRSRKGRHAPVVRLKSSSGNRKSRHHELCISSTEQTSAPLPPSLESDNAAMMGFLTSATGIVKRLVFKTF